MKKTLILAVCLCQALAYGAGDITLGSLYGESVTATWDSIYTNVSHSGNDVTIGAAWWYPTSAMNLDETIVLNSDTEVKTLAFNFDYVGINDGVFGITFMGGDKMLVIGNKDYGDRTIMADYVTHQNGKRDYSESPSQAGSFAIGNNADDRIQVLDKTSATAITLSGSKEMHISGSFRYTGSEYELVLSNGTESEVLSLGSAFSIDRIAFTGAGASEQYVKNLSITPEPATATLSLLALAGLASRRRRH